MFHDDNLFQGYDLSNGVTLSWTPELTEKPRCTSERGGPVEFYAQTDHVGEVSPTDDLGEPTRPERLR